MNTMKNTPVALAVLSRYAVDSRRQRDRVDRYWWPEG